MIVGAGSLAAVLLALTLARGFSGASSGSNEETLATVRSMLREDAGDTPRVRFRDALRAYYGDSDSLASSSGRTSASSSSDDPSARLLWIDDGALADEGERLLETIQDVASEGLDPRAFQDSVVDRAITGLESSAGGLEAARAELLLSDAFLRLADRVARGSDEPATEGLTWDIERDEIAHAELLAHLADGRSPDEELERLRPRVPWYEPMVEALHAYTEVERNGGWPSLPTGTTVALNDTSPVVETVRARLASEPDARVRGLAEGGEPSDVFDVRLAEAVAAFQERHGIAVDSMAGPSTMAAMNVSATERVAELRLNLDRLRRLPRELGSRAILVNVAGYELVVLEGDEIVMQMDVVVGQPEWRTSIFQGLMQYLEVNPYWHVPASIEAREILPRLKEDAGYLEREHLVVVDPDDSYGPPIAADTIDWSEVDSTSFPYDFRQEPGPWNALGSVKFMFPNGYNIYLHDSPAAELFQRHARAFSHGCIRLERPLELARYLLEHASDTSPAELDALRAEGVPTRIDLTESIPVFIAYFTAWVDESGAVFFYPDVYDLDQPLVDAEEEVVRRMRR